MREMVIMNYIDIDGENVPMESLEEEKRKKIAELIQDRIMSAAGYRRKPPDGGKAGQAGRIGK